MMGLQISLEPFITHAVDKHSVVYFILSYLLIKLITALPQPAFSSNVMHGSIR